MDTLILFDGGGFLFDLETRLARKEGENGWSVLSGTIGAEFYLVTYFFWTEGAFVGTNRNCGDVGFDCDDDEEISPAIEIGILSVRTISAVGKLCHYTQCGDCGIELVRLPIQNFIRTLISVFNKTNT